MRLFLYPEKDSIENTSVKTPLNSVDFTSTFILAERDLGFSFAKFKMADVTYMVVLTIFSCL